MNPSFIRRLQGILVAMVVVLAVGAAGTATATASEPAPSAQVSGLTKAQKRAKARALRKCRKLRNAGKRKACIRKVKRKYAALAAPKGKTYVVDVRDNYYVPALVQLKVNDFIKWDWRYSVSSEPHNVSLMTGPSGVSPFEFESPNLYGPNDTFKRQFRKAGNYNLFCTLHAGMTMDVQVSP